MTAEQPAVTALWACGDLAKDPGGGTSCRVREFASLSDGREIMLLAHRGWTSSAPIDEISLMHVVRNISNVVLPDNAEETGEQHESDQFEGRLRDEGIIVTADALRSLPYRVVVRLP